MFEEDWEEEEEWEAKKKTLRKKSGRIQLVESTLVLFL